MLMEDYIEDLREYPQTAISAACKAYRSKAENVFFPSSAVLVTLAKHEVYPIKRRITAIEKILSTEPEKPIERGEVDLSGLIRDPDPEPVKREPLEIALMVSVWKGQGKTDAEIEELSRNYSEAA